MYRRQPMLFHEDDEDVDAADVLKLIHQQQMSFFSFADDEDEDAPAKGAESGDGKPLRVPDQLPRGDTLGDLQITRSDDDADATSRDGPSSPAASKRLCVGGGSDATAGGGYLRMGFKGSQAGSTCSGTGLPMTPVESALTPTDDGAQTPPTAGPTHHPSPSPATTTTTTSCFTNAANGVSPNARGTAATGKPPPPTHTTVKVGGPHVGQHPHPSHAAAPFSPSLSAGSPAALPPPHASTTHTASQRVPTSISVGSDRTAVVAAAPLHAQPPQPQPLAGRLMHSGNTGGFYALSPAANSAVGGGTHPSTKRDSTSNSSTNVPRWQESVNGAAQLRPAAAPPLNPIRISTTSAGVGSPLATQASSSPNIHAGGVSMPSPVQLSTTNSGGGTLQASANTGAGAFQEVEIISHQPDGTSTRHRVSVPAVYCANEDTLRHYISLSLTHLQQQHQQQMQMQQQQRQQQMQMQMNVGHGGAVGGFANDQVVFIDNRAYRIVSVLGGPNGAAAAKEGGAATMASFSPGETAQTAMALNGFAGAAPMPPRQAYLVPTTTTPPPPSYSASVQQPRPQQQQQQQQQQPPPVQYLSLPPGVRVEQLGGGGPGGRVAVSTPAGIAYVAPQQFQQIQQQSQQSQQPMVATLQDGSLILLGSPHASNGGAVQGQRVAFVDGKPYLVSTSAPQSGGHLLHSGANVSYPYAPQPLPSPTPPQPQAMVGVPNSPPLCMQNAQQQQQQQQQVYLPYPSQLPQVWR